MLLFRPGPDEPLRPAPASPLLTHLAGGFAPAIAALWPAPHTPFLVAEASRRHLLCMALADAGHGPVAARAILERPLKQAVRAALGDPPLGLCRALGRLGEQAWTEAEYADLRRVLTLRGSAKMLRHSQAIDRARVRTLARLPDALLDKGTALLLADEACAGLLAEAFDALVRRDGAAAADSMAARWSQTPDLVALADAVRLDLEPEPPPPPFAGNERLRPLADKAAILNAADRYRNCLRDQIHWASNGDSAFYEWLGEPSIVLEITRDRLHGWRLDQARLADNKPVPLDARGPLVDTLRSMGVHVGRSVWDLSNALRRLGQAPAPSQPEQDVVAALFEE
ncbi:MAG: hypothetical protein ACXWKY_17085 [Caulobacteraceae bacterium]